jgi:NitT/TauT family transport system ATP-binding protein
LREPFIHLAGVRKVYGEHLAISDASFDVMPGELVALVGPSGCGKSTLLKAVAGFIAPAEGRMLLRGREIAKPGPDRVVVFQEFDQLLPWKTVRDNVVFALTASGKLAKKAAAERALHFIAKVGLTKFADSFPHTLSGGMKQRVAIARAMAMEPQILLMDEPFGALDEIVRDHLNEQLLQLWAKTNKTVVFVTHSIPEAVFLSTKIVVMTPRPGKIHDIIDSDLPRDRTLDVRETPEFLKIAHRVRAGLRAGHSYED